MDEIIEAVKNNDIDVDSASDILIEFVDESKISKIKNILKLLSKQSLSLESALKMIKVMEKPEFKEDNTEYINAKSFFKSNENILYNQTKLKAQSKSSSTVIKSKQNRAARPLEKEEYEKIMKLCKNGFKYEDGGKFHTFRPNEQLALTFLLQANLGLRISDVLKLTPSTLKNDKLEIIEKKTGKLQYRDINKNLKGIIYEYALEHSIKPNECIIKLKRRGVHKQLSIITDYLKLSNVSSHSFRKFYSMTVYNQTDGDIELLKELLNHSSIATTQKYIRRTQEEINKVSSSIDFTYSWQKEN